MIDPVFELLLQLIILVLLHNDIQGTTDEKNNAKHQNEIFTTRRRSTQG